MIKIPSTLVFSLCIAFFISVLSVLPDIWAYIKTPNGYSFIGVNYASNIDDIFGNYYSSIRQASEGAYLYTNPFEYQPKKFIFYPLYFGIGKIAGVFGVSVELAYLVSGFVLAILFCVFLFWFLRLFITDRIPLFVAFFLCNFGAVFPLAAPDSNAFFGYKFPHYTVSLLALFFLMYFVFTYFQSKGRHSVIGIVGSTFVLSVIHPWMCVPVALSYALWVFTSDKRALFTITTILPVILIFAICFPIAYYFSSNIGWASYNYADTFHILLALFGPILVFTAVGVWRVQRTEDKKSPLYFLLVWFFVELAFSLVPFPFARRFYEGLFLPVSVFAVIGIGFFLEKRMMDRFVGYVVIPLFLSIGTISTYLTHFLWISNMQVYRPTNEFVVSEYLRSIAGIDSRVLSLASSSIFLSGRVNASYYVGHSIQTPEFEIKKQKSLDYFSGAISSEERETLIRDEQICYVYVGRDEMALGRASLQEENYLTLVFNSGDVSLYKSLSCIN